MERKELMETLEIAVYLFKTAKRVRKKYGKYHGVSMAVEGLEDAAFETMCGTANINADQYLEAYYKGLINIEELVYNLAFPKAKDYDGEDLF